MPLVFVYGSLKKDKKLHYFLKEAQFISYAKTCYKYPLIKSKNGWYPYLLDIKGKGKIVKGEVYKISFNLLKKLDRLEEVPFYYIRKKICVQNKKKFLAYTYFKAKNIKFNKNELLSEF